MEFMIYPVQFTPDSVDGGLTVTLKVNFWQNVSSRGQTLTHLFVHKTHERHEK